MIETCDKCIIKTVISLVQSISPKHIISEICQYVLTLYFTIENKNGLDLVSKKELSNLVK